MRGGAVILGDWTHRRGDVGGARAVAAEVGRARPAMAWTFRPPHGGNVDQVRIAGGLVYVATMAPGDPAALGWEHATIHVLEATTGRVVATRSLPDPAPVAAMIVDGNVVHVLATRHGEPIFWYALDAGDLRPRHRRPLRIDRASHWDVLEAWASADGGLWMELDGASTRGRSVPDVNASAAHATGGKRMYAFVKDDVVTLAPRAKESTEPDALSPRDACCVGQTLYAPSAGDWDDAGNGTPPTIWQLDPSDAGAESGKTAEPWARSGVTGPHSHLHALAADGVVSAIAIAVDPTDTTSAAPSRRGQPGKPPRVLVQAMTVDRATGVVRAQSQVERLGTRGAWGEAARLARRPSGELVFQCIDPDGLPSSDLWRIAPGGELVPFPLPRETLLLDAALGDLLLAHAETKDGRVLVSALDVDKERLLGKRATTIWSIETPDLGGSTTVYAGAGHVLARGAQALAAIRV